MNKKIAFAILVLSLTTIVCTTQAIGQASPTPDVNAMVNGTLTALVVVSDTPDQPVEQVSTVPTDATVVQVPTTPVVPTDITTGSISGHLSYPSDFIPPLRVVAFNAANPTIYDFVDTAQNQSEYTIYDLPVGVYHIVSYKIGSPLAGGYTQMVPCGLAYGCDDHSLIDVTVTAGAMITGIDPGDWYADAAAFPPMPTP